MKLDTMASGPEHVEDRSTDNTPDSRPSSIALANPLRRRCSWITRKGSGANPIYCSNVVPEMLNSPEHGVAWWGGSPASSHADGSNRMNNAIVAGFSVVGAPDSWESELTQCVKGETFIDGMGNGSETLPATIIFRGKSVVPLSVPHHKPSQKLIVLVEIPLI